jgi:hypothetical protein
MAPQEAAAGPSAGWAPQEDDVDPFAGWAPQEAAAGPSAAGPSAGWAPQEDDAEPSAAGPSAAWAPQEDDAEPSAGRAPQEAAVDPSAGWTPQEDDVDPFAGWAPQEDDVDPFAGRAPQEAAAYPFAAYPFAAYPFAGRAPQEAAAYPFAGWAPPAAQPAPGPAAPPAAAAAQPADLFAADSFAAGFYAVASPVAPYDAAHEATSEAKDTEYPSQKSVLTFSVVKNPNHESPPSIPKNIEDYLVDFKSRNWLLNEIKNVMRKSSQNFVRTSIQCIRILPGADTMEIPIPQYWNPRTDNYENMRPCYVPLNRLEGLWNSFAQNFMISQGCNINEEDQPRALQILRNMLVIHEDRITLNVVIWL